MIVNAAMIPNPGTFRYRQVSVDLAADWLETYGECAVSYVGYQQTADHLAALVEGRVKVSLNRAKCEMAVGDEALVCKLAYRVANPATKGQPQPEDWEYGLLERLRDRD